MGEGHEDRRMSATARGVRVWEKGRAIIHPLIGKLFILSIDDEDVTERAPPPP